VKGNLGIIGAGVVGTAVGVILKSRGYEIAGVASRTPESRERLAGRLQCPEYADLCSLARSSGILLITTTDAAIGEVVANIASGGGFRPGQAVIHCSGALGSDVLGPARLAGAHVLSIHPLQSFASPEVAVQQLPGSIFTIEGDDEAVPLARQLVEDLGGRAFRIDGGGKALYHAGACVASNFLVSLLDFAAHLLAETGIPYDQAIEALLPLVEGTVRNVRALGIPQALTGPISRGDINTVAKHVEAIESGGSGSSLRLYSLLGLSTVEVARRKGTITAEQALALTGVLGKVEGEVLNAESDHGYVS